MTSQEALAKFEEQLLKKLYGAGRLVEGQTMEGYRMAFVFFDEKTGKWHNQTIEDERSRIFAPPARLKP